MSMLAWHSNRWRSAVWCWQSRLEAIETGGLTLDDRFQLLLRPPQGLLRLLTSVQFFLKGAPPLQQLGGLRLGMFALSNFLLQFDLDKTDLRDLRLNSRRQLGLGTAQGFLDLSLVIQRPLSVRLVVRELGDGVYYLKPFRDLLLEFGLHTGQFLGQGVIFVLE